jgi:hypothetical protein
VPLLKLTIDHIEAERSDILRNELFDVLQKFALAAGTNGADLPTELRSRDGLKVGHAEWNFDATSDQRRAELEAAKVAWLAMSDEDRFKVKQYMEEAG